jgi:GNAT superfamily N-acetyltransferase
MITYRKATADDIKLLANYRIEFLIDFWGQQIEADVEELSANLQRIYSDYYIKQCYICYIAYEGDTIAGIGGMILREQPGNFKNPSGKVGYIMNMYTLPAYRRRGIGGQILTLLIDDAAKLGYRLFELHATKEGEPLYIKHGFKIHSEPTYRKYLVT